MTSSKSKSFSCRQIRTREVQVDMGAPYNLSAIDEDRAIDFTNNFFLFFLKMKENQTPSLLLYQLPAAWLVTSFFGFSTKLATGFSEMHVLAVVFLCVFLVLVHGKRVNLPVNLSRTRVLTNWINFLYIIKKNVSTSQFIILFNL